MRHGAKRIPATCLNINDEIKVTLSEQDQGIAPGQFIVFYQDNYCLGSGIIKLANTID